MQLYFLALFWLTSIAQHALCLISENGVLGRGLSRSMQVRLDLLRYFRKLDGKGYNLHFLRFAKPPNYPVFKEWHGTFVARCVQNNRIQPWIPAFPFVVAIGLDTANCHLCTTKSVESSG